MGNVIELRERVFLFKAKPEGLTEYSPGRQPWDKDLIIFLALKGRYIILIYISDLGFRIFDSA